MPCSESQAAWRGFIQTMKKIALVYHISITGVSNVMTPAKARLFFRKVVLKAHPDKGGSKSHFEDLWRAKEKGPGAAPIKGAFTGVRGKPRGPVCRQAEPIRPPPEGATGTIRVSRGVIPRAAPPERQRLPSSAADSGWWLGPDLGAPCETP